MKIKKLLLENSGNLLELGEADFVQVQQSGLALSFVSGEHGSVFVGMVDGSGRMDWKVAAPHSPTAGRASEALTAGTPPPSEWVRYEKMDEEALRFEVVKFASWGNHEDRLTQLESIFLRRFPGSHDIFQGAIQEGKEQSKLLNRLDQMLRTGSPESSEVREICSALTDRWPAVRGKVEKRVKAARLRAQNLQERGGVAAPAPFQPSTVMACGDQRVAALKPAHKYCVLIDETGDKFELAAEGKMEGKFVAIIASDGALPSVALHATTAAPAECDKVLQTLIDCGAAVLGVRLSDLPELPGDRWYDGVLELLFWIVRLVPLPEGNGAVSIEAIIENRGSAGKGDRWPEAALVLRHSLARQDPARAARIKLEILVDDKKHPLLPYADVVAHAWAGRNPEARSRLSASKLAGRCLPQGDSRAVREAWDSYDKSGRLTEVHWRALLEQKDATDELSLAGQLLLKVGRAASENSAHWREYLTATRSHLEGKRIHLQRLSREIAWLSKWRPAEGRLPLEVEFLWKTAQLAEGNHYGDIASQMVGELTEQGNRLLEERAPLVCWADLHRAVAHTNRFEFELATKALARWKTEPPRVAGLQLWGRVQSSFGQHAAFQGRHAEAREHFQLALMAFDELSDQTSAALDRMQTGTYFAINEMDDLEADPLRIRAAVELVTGSLTDAVPRLARSASRADQYVHHLLLRWMFTMQARFPQTPMPEVALYLAEEAHWGREYGHPWPLICGYRALLLPEPKKAASLLREAVNLSWSEDQKGTVRLIGAVIAAIAESGGMAFPNLETEIFEIEDAIPAVRGRLAQLEDWREAPGSPMELLRAVLPFNFH